MKSLKEEVLLLVKEAQDNGARLKSICNYIDLTEKTIQRWKNREDLQDKRE